MADQLEMTQEEFDTKLAEAVTAGLADLQGEHTALGTKNADLLDELKKSRARVEAFKDFDPAEVKAALAKSKETERKALESAGEYEKALKLEKEQHATEVEGLQKQLVAATSEGQQLRVTTALDKALDTAKVPAHFKPAVRAMHQANVSIIEEDGKKVAVIGGKPVAEFMQTWAETDEGKYFVGDGGQSGGGAAGGSKGAGGDNPWAKDTRNLSQQGIMERDDPTRAKKLKREAGVAA